MTAVDTARVWVYLVYLSLVFIEGARGYLIWA
jgi:hypothetical protein